MECIAGLLSKNLGAKFAVCAEYDYLDEEVKLERWLRYFIAPDQKLLSEFSALFRLKPCVDYRHAAKLVDSGAEFACPVISGRFVCRGKKK